MFNLKKKGVSPATGSPTATLLRLHYNCMIDCERWQKNYTKMEKRGIVFFICILGFFENLL